MKKWDSCKGRRDLNLKKFIFPLFDCFVVWISNAEGWIKKMWYVTSLYTETPINWWQFVQFGKRWKLNPSNKQIVAVYKRCDEFMNPQIIFILTLVFTWTTFSLTTFPITRTSYTCNKLLFSQVQYKFEQKHWTMIKLIRKFIKFYQFESK